MWSRCGSLDSGDAVALVVSIAKRFLPLGLCCGQNCREANCHLECDCLPNNLDLPACRPWV